MIGPRVVSVVAAIAVATACGRRQGRDTSERIAPQPGDHTAPMVLWRNNGFVTERLPAVARGAEIVVVVLRENDAGRGFPNLRIEIRDRGDKVMRSIEVMNSNEYETLAPTGAATPTLARRIAAANLELAKLHAIHCLAAMKPLDMPHSDDGGDPFVASSDEISAIWRDDRLQVQAFNAPQRVASVDVRPWLAPPHASCALCAPCENPAFLGAVYHAPRIDVVVAQIRYRGSDACWEPSDQFHVVAW